MTKHVEFFPKFILVMEKKSFLEFSFNIPLDFGNDTLLLIIFGKFPSQITV